MKDKITEELHRMEEDCTHSGKAHFNAADRWTIWNYLLGIPSVILSAAAGGTFLGDYPVIAGSMALVVTVLAALTTFLKPSEKSALHKIAGDQYLSLRNNSRVFREVELADAINDKAALETLRGLTSRRDDLNQASPAFSRKDFEKARAGIESGEATHKIDKGR